MNSGSFPGFGRLSALAARENQFKVEDSVSLPREDSFRLLGIAGTLSKLFLCGVLFFLLESFFFRAARGFGGDAGARAACAVAEAAAELFEGDRLVAELAALFLSRDDDARRQVGEADCRVAFVDVLAAGAAAPEGVHIALGE